jgi:hypothetical protein
MARILVTLLAGTVLLLLSATGVQAKGPSYLVTGGELGDYAGHVGLEEYLPGPAAEPVEAPRDLPDLAYDLYNSSGNLAVPYQIATGGPEFRYYPNLRLLHQREADRWYQPSADLLASLDAAVAEALAAKTRGELERDPVVADFRARSLHDVTYWLRPTSTIAFDDTYYASAPFSCDGLPDCATVTRSSEVFIMGDLIETLGRPLRPADGARAAFVIEYYGSVDGGGIGGILGFYSPAADGQPGRFWYASYFHDHSTPYHETTPGFDAAVAEALEREAGVDGAATAQGQSSEGAPSEFLVATVAGLGAALALGGTAALVTRARRQKAGRTARPAS